jgi:hypothetical protein
VLSGYAASLAAVESKLMVVTDNRRFIDQLRTAGVIDPTDVYTGSEVIGETVRRAHEDAVAWTKRDLDRDRSRRLGDAHSGDWPPDQIAP